MNNKTHNGKITELRDNQVFVFGANEDGFHGAGSAGYASFGVTGNRWREFNYASKPKGWKGKWNQKGHIGPMLGTEGKSYGLVTVTKPGAKRSITERGMIRNIQALYGFAMARPELEFLVAQSDKGGLNGYSGKEMARFFSALPIPPNMVFEDSFALLLQEPPPAGPSPCNGSE